MGEKSKKLTVGFVGCGNMAVAMIGGIVKKKDKEYYKEYDKEEYDKEYDVIVSNRTIEKLLKAKEDYNNIRITQDNKEVVIQ